MSTDHASNRRTQVRYIDHRSFAVGGAPRSLAAGAHAVCVGLRDGSVASFPAYPKQDFVEPNILQPPDGVTSNPARALCHVVDRWWVVAGPARTFHWFSVDEHQKGNWYKSPPEVSGEDVTRNVALVPIHMACMDAKDERLLLVSYTRSDGSRDKHVSLVSRVIPSESAVAPPKLQDAYQLPLGRLRAVTRLHDLEGGTPCWLLVSYTSDMMILSRPEPGRYVPLPLPVSWGEGRESAQQMDIDFRPALVTDVAAIREANGAPRNDAVVSTDAGVFVVSVEMGARPSTPPRATGRRLEHAGVRGVPLAVASYTTVTGGSAGTALVCCHDSLGAAHLYAAELANGPPSWNRIQSTVRMAPAIQALALGPPGDAGPIVIWQNCRDETIEVARYEPIGIPGVAPTPGSLPSAMSTISSLHEARNWLEKEYARSNGPVQNPMIAADADESQRQGEGNLWAAATPEGDPEALLADLFDPLPGQAGALWEFLANPSIHLAVEAIGLICKLERRPAARAERLRESVDLWAQTLVGSVHTHSLPIATEDAALGIVRWLDRLRQWALALHGTRGTSRPEVANVDADDAAEIADAAESALFDVRRWTLFAPRSIEQERRETRGPSAERRRPHRLGIASQLSQQRARKRTGAENRHDLEEQIAKESVLFNQRIDDEAWEPQKEGGISYHVARLDLGGGKTLCAVLWRQHTIRLFMVDADGKLGARRGADIGAPPGSRFGRSVVLWKSPSGRAVRLLTSVRDKQGEHLKIYDLYPFDAQRPPIPLEPRDPVPLGHDTLTSLRLVQPKRSGVQPRAVILMGLRRQNGEAAVEVVEVADERGGKVNVAHRSILLREAHGASIPNPVHSVHFVQSHGVLRIVAGCDDGTIYLVEGEPPQAQLRSAEATRKPARAIARMAAPVWSIRCREQSDGRLRVFAGTADGHIAAWQELAPAPDQSLPQFASLWCTREADSIVGLWTFNAYLDCPESKELTQVVFAVARNGRAVLFSDQDSVVSRDLDAMTRAEPDPRDRLNRPRVPGQRLERFKLRSSAFSVAHIDIGPHALEQPDTVAWPIARLLVVTGGAVVRVIGLHQPKRSGTRRKAYKEHLGRLWLDSISHGAAGEGSSRDARFRPHRLRYPEALRALAPALWLLPIPFFLLKGWDQCGPLLEVPIRWYPRYLRPYVRCAHAHRRVTQALTATEDNNFDDWAFQANCVALAGNIEACLRNAYELGTKPLFAEIVENLEKRFNATILGVCEREGHSRDQQLLAVYTALLDGLERACRPWLTSDVEAYAHVQTVRIKNLVDGDVLRALAIKQKKRPLLQELMQLRVRHVQRLLQDGNPLVPLEALRAVNFSLLRACWFTTDMDPVWPGMRRFVEVVGAFAAQAGASADDALAHELARVYALCTLLSPREAIRVAISMRSARLAEPIIPEVKAQLVLLRELLRGDEAFNARRVTIMCLREEAAKVFEHALDNPPGYPIGGVVTAREPAPATASAPLSFEQATRQEWRAWAKAFQPCLQALVAFEDATRNLQLTPERVSFRAVQQLNGPLVTDQSSTEGGKRAHFRRDREFFYAQLRDLEAVCLVCGVATTMNVSASDPLSLLLQAHPPGSSDPDEREFEDERPVSPAVVLASKLMEGWATGALKALADTPHMEPQRSLYKSALEEFRTVTGNLRSSSAVQRRLVTGVLGHHLMESLEEHVLRLFETANVLYPHLPAVGDPAALSGTMGSHARDLTEQAEHARAIPKNLRSLYQLLNQPEGTAVANTCLVEVYKHVFDNEIPGVRLKPPPGEEELRVSPQVAAAMGLIFGELASNQRVHGNPDGEIRLEASKGTDDKRILRVTLPIPPLSHKAAARLVDVARTRMQAFLSPAEGVEESSGVGLYLANLAASTVGWRLEIECGKRVYDRYRNQLELSSVEYAEAARQLVYNNTISFLLSEIAP